MGQGWQDVQENDSVIEIERASAEVLAVSLV